MKKVGTTPQDGTKPKLSIGLLHEQINSQNAIIDTQAITINALIHQFNSQNEVLSRLSTDYNQLKDDYDSLSVKVNLWQLLALKRDVERMPNILELRLLSW